MTSWFLFPVLLIMLLIHSCSTPPSLPAGQEVLTAPAARTESIGSAPEPAQAVVSKPTQDTAPEAEAAPPNCLGDEISPIGLSIAEEYDFTSYEEVMTWFCNGAEFEDILVALETESQTDVPAEEMLGMLADGFTWEEIWQLIGLTE